MEYYMHLKLLMVKSFGDIYLQFYTVILKEFRQAKLIQQMQFMELMDHQLL